MVDFTQGKKEINKFGGSEKKVTIIVNGERYMVKFPDPIRAKNNPLSYMNNQFSEYIGCHIFKSAGIKTQETVLGYYIDEKGKQKHVVGCKDFTYDGSVLYEFSKLANELHQTDEKITTSIEDINLIIESNDAIKDKAHIKERFWDVFVIDALIGNSDRHFDNFGIIEKDGIVDFAPVYDCGSSLAALLGDDDMQNILKEPIEFKSREYNVTSCFSYQGKRIFYHEIFKNPPRDLSLAIKRIVPKIKTDEMQNIINKIEYISAVRKNYLVRALEIRYDAILLPAYKS